MHWVILPLKRYADFSGRSRRMEYWSFTLALFLLMVGIFLVQDLLGVDPDSDIAAIPVMLLVLGTFVPSLAVLVRRLHDQDKSGWNVLWYFFPFIGSLIVLVFLFLNGTQGENRFGPDPKQPDGDLADVFS